MVGASSLPPPDEVAFFSWDRAFFLIDIKCWENEITINACVIRHECKQQIHEKTSGKCEGDCKEAIKLKGLQGILKFPACYRACIIQDNEQATV